MSSVVVRVTVIVRVMCAALMLGAYSAMPALVIGRMGDEQVRWCASHRVIYTPTAGLNLDQGSVCDVGMWNSIEVGLWP